jgi:hypothetical protein
MTAVDQPMAKYERANEHIAALEAVLAKIKHSYAIERIDEPDGYHF